ncbi:MAG: hypothetical protein ACK5T0_01005, partial [Vampirovibrionales bacterium]
YIDVHNADCLQSLAKRTTACFVDCLQSLTLRAQEDSPNGTFAELSIGFPKQNELLGEVRYGNMGVSGN